MYVRVNALLSVSESGITENSSTLICELPPILKCVISQFKTNNMNINVTNITSDVTGSVMAYNYIANPNYDSCWSKKWYNLQLLCCYY